MKKFKKFLKINLLVTALLSIVLATNIFAEDISHIRTLDDLSDDFIKMDISAKLSADKKRR